VVARRLTRPLPEHMNRLAWHVMPMPLGITREIRR
jgi:hypothetical protein